MLQIKNISKTYKTGNFIQHALKNVSLNLRDSEFVAILGPSGSGKTTLLNIIGGLDKYDSGDLIINNVSTSRYKDRDFDAYRNHTIGFVFQSYNLIPHQSVLSNVELALTIGGVSKKERKARALKALDEVGLKDQAHKRPNQLSGGQMQRVAIARALVNDPDIVLADEPTGALDSQTSLQVMDLLSKVAKDRLVVMVTHNPELAQQYATRIVKLRDGQITSDTNPLVIENPKQGKKNKRLGKARMSLFTALSLSFNNLLTKKGRTILTAFAGSIGIIGIALILSLSQGFQNYIDKIQEDTLSSYPLTITSETADAASAILSMVSDHKENKVEGENVIERQYLSTMFSSIGTNDLKSFKKYLEDNMDDVEDCLKEVRYSYSVTPQIYTIDAVDKLVKLFPSSMWSTLYSDNSISMLSSIGGGGGGIFSEVTDDFDSIKDQYDLLKGRWPEKFNEIIIVLSEPNSISDLLVYSLGLRDTAELRTIITDVMAGEEVEIENEQLKLTYDDLLNIQLKLVKATDTYKYNDKYNIYEDMSEDDDYMRNIYNNSLDLKVVGIVCPSGDEQTMALSAGVCYSKSLTQYVIDEAQNTAIVQKQIRNKDVDVFSNDRFDEINDEEKEELDFEDMISIDEDLIKEAFKFNLDEDSFTSGIDEEDMANTIMEISMDTAREVGRTEVQELAQTFQGLNTMVLMRAIDDYEKANLSDSGIESVQELDLSKVDKYKRMLHSPYYQYVLTDYIDSMENQEDAESMKAMIEIFDDETFEDLASAVRIMFGKYYDSVKTHTTTEEILYTKQTMSENEVTIYLNPTNPRDMLIGATLLPTLMADEEVASITSSVALQMGSLQTIATNIGKATTEVMTPIFDSLSSIGGDKKETDDANKESETNEENSIFEIDTDKFAEAFKFDMDQDELQRIMTAMMTGTSEKTYKKNLISLGYQDVDDPTNISFFFKDFDAKEKFMDFLRNYNESLDEDNKLRYTDITGLLMSSVKKIVDSVSYVLIAFVSISLVVSSIMIAVITLISVMERTKEIGILRAMGASKHNVSSIFNAETFIIGLLSGLLGVGVTYLSIPPINNLIHNVTDNYNINAVLPTKYAFILVLISVFLTIIAGIIPSKKASKQDPVIALRSE